MKLKAEAIDAAAFLKVTAAKHRAEGDIETAKECVELHDRLKKALVESSY